MRIEFGGGELFDELRPLWEALFDHHVSVGAAGLATIPREQSWPLRAAHYERIFAGHPWAGVWLARGDDASGSGADRPIGYALAFETELDFRAATVLETLSLLPEARGTGAGSELMRLVFEEAAGRGAELGIIDVMGGNDRAKALYLRSGHLPYSETWMRSTPPAQEPGAGRVTFLDGSLVKLAARSGFDLEFLPGPDDTWVSPDRLALLTPVEAESAWTIRELELLFAALQSSGLWTILVEIPVPPRAAPLREALAAAGFRLALERLVRQLAG
ncbi:GNAT family N-acetyltransferase [Leucobacter soli]|uniref:N-acetyltransferase domain-containing protein n=1 Tax=Leucobacter soli TaxID=2812850 RepID=A0A916NNY7_9MICO|nr:GNAT family N-acetyltransferase [Leucobacter soli]CAG7616036.1 hypothetical protein LEUCIP111803_01942 [Leucobacter soli]